MPKKKTVDPKRIALLDKQERLRADFEKSYSRMMRAVRRMEKARKALGRIARQLARMEAEEGRPAAG